MAIKRPLKRWQDTWVARLSGFAPARVTWVLVAIFSVWVLVDVYVIRATSGVAKPVFDAMVRARLWVAEPDARIVIIDIDEASLARMGREFGRWPWPRDTLATVLTHIERQQPAALVWDIVFSDADRLSPGGDAAFNAAAQRSLHSHFSVVRLPDVNDAASQITRDALPGLWVGPASAPAQATVAVIAPALPGVAASRLGYNNGYVDKDGVLRRYRYAESLGDGSTLQSIALSVANTTNLIAYSAYLTGTGGQFHPKNELIAWRRHANAYPRLSFADVFAQADGAKSATVLPNLAGKIVIIGSTAPSLHDIHPTPLSPLHAGVDSLATAVDNAINQRRLAELPPWLQAGFAISMCAALALWVQFKSAASLAPALFALPAALVVISYLSLNGAPVFLDLQLSAALALVFLGLLRGWGTMRRNFWCSPPDQGNEPMAIWALQRNEPWLEGPLDRLIDAVQRHAPSCRVVLFDISSTWPMPLRWPELARFAAVVGPQSDLLGARARLEPSLKRLTRRSSEPLLLESRPDREELAKRIFLAWASLQKADPAKADSGHDQPVAASDPSTQV